MRHLDGVLLIAALTWLAIAAVHGVADGVRAPSQDVADNLQARRVLTQTRVLSRTAIGVLLVAGVAFDADDLPAARARSAPACWPRRA